MKVVLDSNIIISDFWMQSPSFKVLLESAKNGDIELFIPQVVLDEVINKLVQRVGRAKDDINGELAKLQKLTNLNIEVTISDELLNAARDNFQNHIEELIKVYKIKLLDYPMTGHRVLAKKAMLNKKPFNSNEKGYRDSLVWENVKALISSAKIEIPATPEVVFITNNHKDFASDENKLHPDLVEEIREERLTENSVLIYSSLNEYNERIVKMFFVQANIFEEKLRKKDFWDFEIKSLIDSYLYRKFVGSDLSNYYSLAPCANEKPTVTSINDEYSVDDLSVRKLNSHEYVVDVNIEIESEIEYFIDKSDYWSIDDLDVSLVDSDWNDHVALVTRLVDIPIELSLIVNSDLECTGIEIVKVNKDFE